MPVPGIASTWGRSLLDTLWAFVIPELVRRQFHDETILGDPHLVCSGHIFVLWIELVAAHDEWHVVHPEAVRVWIAR